MFSFFSFLKRTTLKKPKENWGKWKINSPKAKVMREN
jgi:hypothetical protein